MKFVDAHSHLSDPEYTGHVEEVINAARNSQVSALVSNSMDLQTCLGSLSLAKKYPDLVYAALGVHPWSAQNISDKELQDAITLTEEESKKGEVLAIGEIGLDAKYMEVWDKQLVIFDQMLQIAEKLDLPVIVHSRGATEKILDIIATYKLKKVLFHWFSNPTSALSKVIDKGYYISEGPPVTFSTGIQDVVRRIPIARLLTETDGPVKYFRPPFKGKLTTPEFIPVVIEAIAGIKKMDPTAVADQVTKNFEEFFTVKLN